MAGIMTGVTAVSQLPISAFAAQESPEAIYLDEEEDYIEEEYNQLEEDFLYESDNTSELLDNEEWTLIDYDECEWYTTGDPWNEYRLDKYNGAGGNLIIPSYVTEIGGRAFWYNESITGIKFEEKSRCSSIDGGAFTGCTNLKTFIFPHYDPKADVDVYKDFNIIDSAFSETGLEYIEFPYGGGDFGREYFLYPEAFAYSPIKKVVLNARVVSVMGRGPFAYCPIEEIVFGSDTTIAESLFADADLSNMEELVIPKHIKYINRDAFGNAGIKKIRFEKGSELKLIESEAFLGNPITEIELPSGLSIINDYAFAYTQLTNISLPKSLTFLGRKAFDMTPLKTLVINDKSDKLGIGHSAKDNYPYEIATEEFEDWKDFEDLTIFLHKGSFFEKYFNEYNKCAPEYSYNPITIKYIGKDEIPDEPAPEITKIEGGTYAVGQKIDTTSDEIFGETYEKYTISPNGAASVSKGIATVKKAPSGKKITITAFEKNKKGKFVPVKEYSFTAEKPAFTAKAITLTHPFIEDHPDDTLASIDANTYLQGTSLIPSAWTSANPKVAEVDEKTGMVKAMSKGTTKVSAIFGDPATNMCAKYTIQVKVNIPALSKKTLSLQSGASQALKIKGLSKTSIVVWESSDPESVSVDASTGKVTAKAYNEEKEGKAVVFATLDGIAYPCYQCEVTVTKPELAKSSLNISLKKKDKIVLKKTKFKASQAVFESSNPEIATVTGTGQVIGKSTGECDIFVTIAGIKLTCHVLVSQK